MSRISEKFQELKRDKKKALIAFIEAGDPDLETTEDLVYEMEKRGADLIELGIPFSDPLADGPTIQAAHLRALEKKVSTADVINLVSKIRRRAELPIVLMSGYNLIFKYGISEFVEEAAGAGVDGVIVPDLPPEEAGELIDGARKSNLDTIFLVAPSSTPDRIKRAAQSSTGFIYLVSLLGVTGVRKELSDTIEPVLNQIRLYSDLPVAVGFGISTREQVRAAAEFADGAIVGSAIVEIVAQNLDKPDLVKRVGDFVEDLKRGMF